MAHFCAFLRVDGYSALDELRQEIGARFDHVVELDSSKTSMAISLEEILEQTATSIAKAFAASLDRLTQYSAVVKRLGLKESTIRSLKASGSGSGGDSGLIKNLRHVAYDRLPGSVSGELHRVQRHYHRLCNAGFEFDELFHSGFLALKAIIQDIARLALNDIRRACIHLKQNSSLPSGLIEAFRVAIGEAHGENVNWILVLTFSE